MNFFFLLFFEKLNFVGIKSSNSFIQSNFYKLMSMSSLTDALQMEKSVEESLRNMQGVTSLGVLDPNGSILSVKNKNL
jgi:hypothetical protein